MATTTTNYGFDVPTSSDLVKNGATAISTLGQDIDTFLFRPFGVNRVLNSAMQIWQRGTSMAGSSTAFAADRWQAYRSTIGSTYSRQSTNDTTNLPFIQYATRVQRDSGNTSTTGNYLLQNFESINSIPFAGKTVTFSFYARAGANYSAASGAMEYNLATGTGTDQNLLTGFTGRANPILGNATLTTTWQRFSYSATLATNITQIAIAFAATWVGTAGAADYFEVTGVQLEVGSQATPFKTNAGTIQGELAACQRYYQRVTGITSNSTYFSTGVAISTTRVFCPYSAPVSLRTTPSVAHSSGKVGNGVISNQSITSISAYSNGSYQQVTLDTSVGSGLTASGAFMLVLDQNAYIELSAEL